MSTLLVVVGATGYQGRSVVSWFQKNEPGWRIRGLTRDTAADRATKLSAAGIEVVKADLYDVESLKSAFTGADYIFSYTDFAGIVKSPEVMGKFKAGQLKLSIGEEACQREIQQGINIANAAATISGLRRLVWSSLADVKKWSQGKYTQVFHFDAKAAVAEYMLTHDTLRHKASVLQLGTFTTNFVNGLELFSLQKVRNSRILVDYSRANSCYKDSESCVVWSAPFSGEMKLPWVDVEADIGAFVQALIRAPASTQLLGVSQWLSCDDTLELWSKITGHKTRFQGYDKDFADRDGVKTLFDGFNEPLLQTALFIAEFGFTGGDPAILLPEDIEKAGISVPRHQISNYMAREDWRTFMA